MLFVIRYSRRRGGLGGGGWRLGYLWMQEYFTLTVHEGQPTGGQKKKVERKSYLEDTNSSQYLWLLQCKKYILISSFHADNCIFSFSFVSGVSGTSLFNSVSLMAYNVFYTSVPVLVSVLDKDLSEETVMQHPQILFYCQAGRFDIIILICLDVLILHIPPLCFGKILDYSD